MDNGVFPCSGFLVCVGHFNAVNELSENCRVKLLHIRCTFAGSRFASIQRNV